MSFEALAAQAGPLRFDEQDLVRRVRRRRRAQASGAVLLSAGLAAAAVSVGYLLPAQTPHAAPAVVAASKAPKYCGAPRRTTQISIDPQASGPPDQETLDNAARRIDAIAGGGKEVTKGGKAPGRFSNWYGQSAISNEWHKVIVYRKPNAELDAAICQAIHDVTVEFADIALSNPASQRLQEQVWKAAGHRTDVTIYTTGIEPDGRITLTVDHPDVAKKVLARYLPYLVITKGALPDPLIPGPGRTMSGK